MNTLDVAGLGGESEGFCCNAEQARGVGQVEPGFDAVRSRAEHRDLVMRPERGDPFAGPSVSMAGQQAVSVEDSCNQIVGGDKDKLTYRRDDLGSGAVALAPTPLRQAQLGMHAADPVDQKGDLGGVVVDVGDHFEDDGAHDAFLESGIGGRRRPDRSKGRAEGGGVHPGQGGRLGGGGAMRGDPGLDLAGACEGAVPPRLQFRRHKAVLRVGGVILPERAVGGVAGRFEIARERFANLIAATGGLRLSLGGGSDGARLDHPQQRFLDGVVDP